MKASNINGLLQEYNQHFANSLLLLIEYSINPYKFIDSISDKMNSEEDILHLLPKSMINIIISLKPNLVV